MREHECGLDGRTVGRREQTSERRGGGTVKRHAGTSRPGRWTGGQACKPTAQIEPKSHIARFWLVLIKDDTVAEE